MRPMDTPARAGFASGTRLACERLLFVLCKVIQHFEDGALYAYFVACTILDHPQHHDHYVSLSGSLGLLDAHTFPTLRRDVVRHKADCIWWTALSIQIHEQDQRSRSCDISCLLAEMRSRARGYRGQ
jgi:hypothetical protein